MHEKNTSILRNCVLHGHSNKFTSFLEFLEFWNTSQTDDTSELSTDDSSRIRRKYTEVSVGGRLSHYLLPYHIYGDNNTKQRDFEVNAIALMEHAFRSLSLVDHDFFRKMTQDIYPRCHPVGSSKLLWSLIRTENQSVEGCVVERLSEVKDLLISYDL